MQDNSHEDFNPIVVVAIRLIKALATFPLGNVAITAHAMSELFPFDVLTALERHSQRDWGNVHPEDRGLNDAALLEGYRLVSVYDDMGPVTFWIITEADRSLTTILLPDDY